MSDITGGSLSDYTQLPVEPQKTFHDFFHICRSTPPKTCEQLKQKGGSVALQARITKTLKKESGWLMYGILGACRQFLHTHLELDLCSVW